MIGNDIVDLKAASFNSRWEEQRFLDKIFTEDEQKIIKNSDNKFIAIWRLWSMKESVYKILVQQLGIRSFIPLKLECSVIDSKRGKVKHRNSIYNTESLINKAYIFTESVLNGHKTVRACIKIKYKDYGFQHKSLHHHFKCAVSKLEKCDIKSLSVTKSRFNVPKVFNAEERLDIQFSLSHHGHYGCYSIVI